MAGKKPGRPSQLTPAVVAKLKELGPKHTELTPEVIEKLIGLIEDGNYVETSVLACGIVERCYYRWKSLGDADPDSEYGAFCQALKKAEAQGEVLRLRTLSLADQGWQSAAWWLERRRPEHWARKSTDDPEKVALEKDRLREEIALLKAKQIELEQGGSSAQSISIVLPDFIKEPHGQTE